LEWRSDLTLTENNGLEQNESPGMGGDRKTVLYFFQGRHGYRVMPFPVSSVHQNCLMRIAHMAGRFFNE
jgi:hypothetical protein